MKKLICITIYFIFQISFTFFLIWICIQNDGIKSILKSMLFEELKYEKMEGFTITAYCPGECCNKNWAGYLTKGKKMSDFKGVNIIAADFKILPYGSVIKYKGIEYKVLDCGSAIKGKKIDILLPTHKEAETFGIKRNQTIYRRK